MAHIQDGRIAVNNNILFIYSRERVEQMFSSSIFLMLLTLLSAAAIPVLAQPNDGGLTLNEATFLTSHNAHANLAVVRFLTYIIYECICWKI